MNKIKILLAVALCAGAVSITGCAMFKKKVVQADGSTVAVLDTNKIDKAAVVIRMLITDAAAVGASKGGNTERYLTLAVGIIDEALASNATSPDSLRNAIAALPVRELDEPWGKVAVSNALGAYEIFLQQQFADDIAKNYTARTLLTAVRDGLKAALPSPSPVTTSP